MAANHHTSLDESQCHDLSVPRQRGASHQEAATACENRQPTPPHLVRWRIIDARRSAELRAAGLMEDGEEIRFVINRMHDGRPLAGKIRSAWEGILEDAGLGEDVVRHSLRHTAATWQMQAGTDLWEAAGWLGTTIEQLEQNYGHHHPDFQEESAEAFGGRR
jgi:integrase